MAEENPPAPKANTGEVEALRAKVAELTTRVAATADADTKAFLATIKEVGEKTLAEMAAVKTKLEAAEAAAASAETKVRDAATTTALKEAAKLAGAVDAGDVLAFINKAEIKFNDAGEPENVADLVTALKTAKPHLFGKPPAASTSSGAQPPPPGDPKPKSAKEMKVGSDEYNAALAAVGVNPNRIRRG